jgi:cell division protein FtsW (lipid II flippase)
MAYLLSFAAVSLVWRTARVPGDRTLLGAAHLLTAIGFLAMIARQDPLRDTLLFARYAQGVIAGLAAMTAVSLLDLRKAIFRDMSYMPLLAALLLCVILILFGSGPAGSAAKVNLGPVQPIEAIRLLIALFLAGYFARRWELLRVARGTAVRGYAIPSWLNVPRLDYLLPLVIGVAAALALFFIQKDLGPALVIAVVFLVMYAVARASAVLTAAGFLLLVSGFYLGYTLQISATLAERVRMWQSPWDNAARGGDQIAQALWAMATGGVLGTGGGLGDTRYLPAGHTDLVLASVAEEFGFAGLLIVAIGFVVLAARAMRTARRAGSDYAFFLSLALTLLFVVPVLLMLAGTLGIVPLTGVVTPFLSYGGSAMLANFTALGLLAAAGADSRPASDLACFRPAMRWVGAAAAAAAAALGAVAVTYQAISADEIAVRPHLGLQADGSRRYQYNPRVLDVARDIPRGTVADRRGLPLASDDEAAVRAARADYQRLGITVEQTCARTGERCYPLGGRAFHLLGDARSRARWTASNTSFVERDAEAKLRGFDDHETAVRTVDASGAQGWTVRRDYSDLLPLLRHRHQPGHRAVKAFLAKPRDVRLTIDAALQLRVAAIVSAYARRSSGRAAAVVLDPATGDLLASVSYPWPADGPGDVPEPPDHAHDDLFDRARYGLYPPGSTFKLVTAAAALQRDARSRDTRFVCARLPDGRVGAKIPGWGRPVRDDVLDKHAHGAIDMHQAMVVSCNAYFAQLAVRLGPDALIDSARRVDIALARTNTPGRVRDALPQVGYGQGEVVSTPLRMARVAGAIAADGVVRDVRWDASLPAPAGQPFLTADAARLVARYMRDVVLSGTGRALRDHAVAIAGKTGTAELADAPSHSWFVGFAPYGTAAKRIAVAVLIENAGYGGASAAPAAGEIVSAAAQLGLAR